MKNILIFATSIICLALAPGISAAHNAGASENLDVNGSTPTDRAHDAVRDKSEGIHPDAEFENDSLLDRNPKAGN